MDTAEGGQEVARGAVLEGVWRLMQDGQPRMAKQIAAELTKQGLSGVDKSLVNSVLAREGKNSFAYDSASYTYSLPDPDAAPPPPAPERGSPERTKAAVAPPAPREAVLSAVRNLLADDAPRTAKQIVVELTKQGLTGVDKSLVNSVLSREGKDFVVYDRETFTYRVTSDE